MESRPLEYWLSPQLSQAGQGSTSVLRRMALNDAQSRATCLMLYFWCAWLALIAVVTVFTAPGVVPYAATGALIAGAVASALSARRRRRKTPSIGHPASSRAPRTVRGAWTGIALVAVGASGLMLALMLSEDADLSAGSIAGGVLGLLFIVALFVGTLLIPAWHIENAERLFRERIGREPELRQALEEMARTHSDEGGRLQFGPL
ncbi:hypothetical protein GC088_10975 [Arthrobacter sp. JZ12]|uniref:hypothetical protein n=1 Tax=Arthrobacter sp. JZ12 TaxID=2654190 RepID=UPI002B481C87|nr:hypothetical protein [Arthrobacter sp. JZ12]WRH25535.1 hypothetical protein GC088_10975 [Arthrobacter sp. JZ12]